MYISNLLLNNSESASNTCDQFSFDKRLEKISRLNKTKIDLYIFYLNNCSL